MRIFLQKQIVNYGKYVRESVKGLRPQITFVIILFGTGIALGFTNLLNSNGFINEIINNVVRQFIEYRGIELFIGIFLNNLKATAIIIYAGILLAIFPVLATLVNGMMIGFVLQKMNSIEGKSIYEGILYLVPHGIFEIPSIILALALGVKFGSWPFNKNKIDFIKTNFNESSCCYIKLIVPLLFIAAIIETLGIEAVYVLNVK